MQNKNVQHEAQNSKTEQIILLDNLLTQADKLVEQTIKIEGLVTHTCAHSGMRCFLTGQNEKFTLRVEAGGTIDRFDKEITGKEIIVTGILKEKRLTKQYIDNWEHELMEKKTTEDGSVEQCSAEQENIAEMRDWMKENKKDYFSTYYVDGKSFTITK